MNPEAGPLFNFTDPSTLTKKILDDARGIELPLTAFRLLRQAIDKVKEKMQKPVQSETMALLAQDEDMAEISRDLAKDVRNAYVEDKVNMIMAEPSAAIDREIDAFAKDVYF